MYLCTYISNNPKNENSAAAALNFLNANNWNASLSHPAPL